MKFTPRIRSFAVVLLSVITIAAFAAPAQADHSWSNYHWARKSNPFTIKVIDSMTTTSPEWDTHLDTAIADWDSSTVLNVTEEAGSDDTKTRKRCPAVSGKVRSCNAEYGRTGWLGVAQIWVSGGHIVQGTAKMNDTYFNSSPYNTPAWKQFVVCQEIGHDWGLGHTDETFNNSNQGTCMDYTNDPDGGDGGASNNDPSNEHPNAHDDEQLNTIYEHLDSSTTIAAMPAGFANAELNTPAEWGRLVHQAERSAIYERDFGGGFKVITHVTWVHDHARAHSH